ncbi:hypothetical protein [Sulfurimonas sp.]|uniref:hypothetical protein n=1 Tax=Sulfurimonas sp. TaxID=2022749 RepID=UPI002AAFBF89|nr:hypothetical protein [Sulfurimonas sp.]
MNIFSSLFKKKKQQLTLPDSLLIKKLKTVCKENSLSIYEDITIYHHTQSYFIPLLILNPNKGLYLFEYKEWSYDDLKNATISKASNQDSSSKNLAFEKTHQFIKQKFNELTHNDGVPIYNYLLMQNINSDEYVHLDESFKELLPFNKIMFNNSTEDEILQKIHNTPQPDTKMPSEVEIIGNLLVQYLIFSKDNTKHLASKEQVNFIDSKIEGTKTLSGSTNSGKTSSILLKAILESLRSPDLKIIILEPTVLACDLLKQRLLNIIEYAIIEINIDSIEIITPIAFVNKHLSKLKKPHLEVILHIDEKLMKNKNKVADFIICDDANLLSFEFIEYLKHIQKKSALILVNEYYDEDAEFIFKNNFVEKNVEIIFKEANQHAKALQIVSKLLQKNKAEEILIVSNNVTKNNLSEDLEFFIKDNAILLDSSINLQNQDLENLILCSYAQISSLNTKFVLLLDVEEASLNELKYALHLANDTAYVLYESESENIQILKEKNV